MATSRRTDANLFEDIRSIVDQDDDAVEDEPEEQQDGEYYIDLDLDLVVYWRLQANCNKKSLSHSVQFPNRT